MTRQYRFSAATLLMLTAAASLLFMGCGSGSNTGSSEASTPLTSDDASNSMAGLAPPESSSGFASPMLSELDVERYSNTFDHSCGDFSVTFDDGVAVIWKEVEREWVEYQRVPYPFSSDSSFTMVDHTIAELTGDRDPEIILSWSIEGGMRDVGFALRADPDVCNWDFGTLIDSCGAQIGYEILRYSFLDGLMGSGFSGGCSVREAVVWKWIPEAEVWVARPMEGVEICPEYIESMDFPVGICDSGPNVRAVQERLRAFGYDVKADGFFGPDTQEAVILFQRSRRIVVDGFVGDRTRPLLFDN